MFKKQSVLICLLLFFCFSLFAGDKLWQNVQIGGGGFMPGIIFNTTEPGLIYARADIGGAYRWDPNTGVWVPITDSFATGDNWTYLGIDSLATDPVDPDRVYVVAGMYTNSWTSLNAAVFRSADRGESWEKADLPFKAGGNMPGRSMGERLAIDPNKNSTLYMGARLGEGLFKSTDFGATWNNVTSFPTGGTYVMDPEYDYSKDIIGVVWVVFDKKSGTPGTETQTIYAGVADKGDCIFRSTDGGETWEAVPGQPTGLLPHHGILASNDVLYISYSDTCGPYDGAAGAVYKLDTKSGEWTDITPDKEENRSGLAGLAVDAQNPDTLMVSTMNLWWPDEQIYRSTDGGETWKAIWEFGAYPARIMAYEHDISAVPWLDWGKLPNLPEVTPKLGWMIGDLEIDPFNPDRMMYVTGATVYGSNNLTNWDNNEPILIEPMTMGIEETSCLDLICPPGGAELVSGLGDIGGFVHYDVTKIQEKIFTSPGMTNTTSLDYAGLVPDFIVRVGNSEGSNIGFTYSGGDSWFQGQNIAEGAESGSVAAAADASVVLWSPGGDSAPVSYSTDNGNSWNASLGIPMSAFVGSDRVNAGKFYGFSGGTFYISTDKGKTFTSSAEGLPDGGKFKGVPGIEGDIWLACYDGGLLHSVDSGASFTKIAGVEKAFAVGFGKAAPGAGYQALYLIGTVNGQGGVFQSINGGVSWLKINSDAQRFDNISPTITGSPDTYGRVYFGVNGRGIFYTDLDSAPLYSLTVQDGMGSGDYAEGSVVSISWTEPETAAPGQTAVFTGWTGDVETVADISKAETTLVMPGNEITVKATFKLVENPAYTLTVENGSGDGEYMEGTLVTVGWIVPDVEPGTRAVFTGWTGDVETVADVLKAETTLVMPGKDIKIEAVYTIEIIPEDHNLTVTGGTGSGSYAEGTAITISWTKPDVQPGFKAVFTGWTGDVETAADVLKAETTVTMPAKDINLQATYILEEISGGSFRVAYSINQWNSGATLSITIYNDSGEDVNDWLLEFDFPSGQQVTNAWSCVSDQTGSSVTKSNMSWNRTISAGGSVSFGCNISHNGINEIPLAFTVNGVNADLAE